MNIQKNGKNNIVHFRVGDMDPEKYKAGMTKRIASGTRTWRNKCWYDEANCGDTPVPEIGLNCSLPFRANFFRVGEACQH